MKALSIHDCDYLSALINAAATRIWTLADFEKKGEHRLAAGLAAIQLLDDARNQLARMMKEDENDL